MNQFLPTRTLPERPDLSQLRRQAKELREAFLGGEPSAMAEVNKLYRAADRAKFALHDAQLVLARSYGFDSWPKLKAFIDGVTIGRLIDVVRAGDVEQTRAILRSRPELVNRVAPSSNGYTALHYAVMRRMPDMVRALMEAGADPGAGAAGIYALRDAASPRAIAVERGYDEIAALIRDPTQRRTDDDSYAELRSALQDGDEDLAIDLLERYPELVRFEMSGNPWTPLHLASAWLLQRTASWLLEHGADINTKARDGCSPIDVMGLHRESSETDGLAAMAELLRGRGTEAMARSAVMTGDEECLRRIAAEHDVVTPQDERGWLLRLAVDSDREEILKLLLDFGLDPDARVRVQDEDTITFTWGMPLYQCARSRKHAMAEMLLQRGADPNGRVYASGTPLSEAYGQRDERMIALLERYGGQPNASMAGLYRRADLARHLLDKFGSAHLPDDGFSKGPVVEQLLGAAARGGDPEILRMAMERVDCPDGDPRWNGLLQAPLGFWNHWIGPWCHPEWDRTTYLTCFRMLLERCGAPNAGLNCGATILHQIVAMGDHVTDEERRAFAIAALDAGARMDLRDDLLKSTPLGWACRWGREDLVRLFLDRGAEMVEGDAEAWATPLAWAKKKRHRGIVAMLSR